MDLYAEGAVQGMPDGTFEGKSTILSVSPRSWTRSRMSPTVRSFTEQGDAFADEWTFAGTHTGFSRCRTAACYRQPASG